MPLTPPHSITLDQAVEDFAAAPPLRRVAEWIERLDASADTKALLMDLARVTVSVGGKIIAFGRKVLEIVFTLVAKFQNLTFGVIIALVLSSVIATIPFLGPVMTAILTPIMLAYGIARGAMQDFKDATIRSELDALSSKLALMSNHMVAA